LLCFKVYNDLKKLSLEILPLSCKILFHHFEHQLRLLFCEANIRVKCGLPLYTHVLSPISHNGLFEFIICKLLLFIFKYLNVVLAYLDVELKVFPLGPALQSKILPATFYFRCSVKQ